MDPFEFRQQHLSQWRQPSYTKVAWEAAEAYERTANSCELRILGHPPRFNVDQARYLGLIYPVTNRPISGFRQLFQYHVLMSMEKACMNGFDGSPQEWYEEVKRCHRLLP